MEALLQSRLFGKTPLCSIRSSDLAFGKLQVDLESTNEKRMPTGSHTGSNWSLYKRSVEKE